MRKPWIEFIFGWLLATSFVHAAADEFQATDSVKLRFIGTTFGTNHVGPGQLVARLRRGLPDWAGQVLDRIAPRPGGQVVEFSTDTPHLALWFFDADPTNRDGFRIPHLQPWPSLLPLNSDGIPMGTHSMLGRGGTWPMAITASVYPRRQRELSFAFFRAVQMPSNRVQLLRTGTLNLRNPAPFVGPSWLPQTMPASIATNGLRLTVESVRVLREWRTNQFGVRMMRNQTQVTLGDDFHRAEVSQRVLGISLDDATGNVIRLNRPISTPQLARGSPRVETGSWWTGGSLFDDEKAWRVRVKMAPEKNSILREQFVFTGLVLPKVVEEVNALSEDTSPFPRTIPAPPPPPQYSKRIPGVSISEVSISGFEHSFLAMSFQVVGSAGNTLAGVNRVEDANGLRWDAPLQLESSPGVGDPTATFWSVVLRSSEPSQAAAPLPPFNAVIEVFPAENLSFFVPPIFDPIGAAPGPVGELTSSPATGE